jgi:hypothetical protein
MRQLQRDCLSGISEVSDRRRDVARLTAATPLVRSVMFGFKLAERKSDLASLPSREHDPHQSCLHNRDVRFHLVQDGMLALLAVSVDLMVTH